MKKLLFATAVMILTFSGSQVNAEMLTLTSTNGGSFTFNSVGAGDSLITTNGDNGLSDVAFFLGYRTGGITSPPETQVLQLSAGTAENIVGDTGSFNFETITFGNGVSVDAVANFRLVDATDQGLGHHVVYDLALETSGVNDTTTEGSLLSFVGFDFNGNGADAVQDNEEIVGFGGSDIAIGSSDRTLVGDFTFPAGENGEPPAIAATNTNVDVFNGAIGAIEEARFDGVSSFDFTSGDLAFGAFNDFLSRDIDQTDTTGGVVGFRSSVSATIPEPSTLLMASMGLGMVAFRRRKRV